MIRSRARRRVATAALFAGLGLGATAGATGTAPPILHEPIAPNPGEDLAMHVVLDGNLPAAIETPHGAIAAPDPQVLPAASDATYGPGADHDQFRPDRDTSRPEISGYDDPFSPSTAPFKRLAAFDAVHDDYSLYVREAQLVALTMGAAPGPEDDVFFADAVIDLAADRRVRIPSVGPGARIVRARLGVGAHDVPLRIARDGADNWFLEVAGTSASTGDARARLVMELSLARASFGGPLPDPSWNDLPFVARLPENVTRDAAMVSAAIGVSRQMRPRQAIAALVHYFREFADSNEPPHARGNVYLDLALSKKGVCRHRAFAFLVTAQSLGIPTRMILNEAHAWVEIHDGTLWRRIDLGGAGEFEQPLEEATDAARYDPPADPLPWPQGADRGDSMLDRARSRAQARQAANGRAPRADGSGAKAVADSAATAKRRTSVGDTIATDATNDHAQAPLAIDWRPGATVTVTVGDGEAQRGKALRLQGSVRARGEPCAGVAVDVSLRDPTTGRLLFVGTLATDDDGAFGGGLVVPGSISLGDYDLVARTAGDTRCGASGN